MVLLEKTEYHIAIDIAVAILISRLSMSTALQEDLTGHARAPIPQIICYLILYRKVIRVGGTGGGGMDGRVANIISLKYCRLYIVSL